MSLDFEKEIADVEKRIAELSALDKSRSPKRKAELTSLKRKVKSMTKKVYSELSPWDTVQIARHADRPLLRDFIDGMCSEFLELHGDRHQGDDKAMIGGFATLGGQRCMLIGMVKGRSVEEKVESNFGMPNPEGYRKALRLMKLAERYGLPIVCMVDTPAAYPGREAEERGQAEAIARNLTEMAALEVPIIVVVTGEGGSGGALGIAVGDAILMLRYAVYSVIPPEGCAAILWRDAAKAADAADALKITADSLLEFGVIDEIVDEPAGGAHRDPETTIAATQEAIVRNIKKLKRRGAKRLVDQRYNKFVKIGRFKHARS
ncbi:MAG: acetyl-CoA carboxylase carboxyltransferase subunit alpha [Verrucomicrobia bacterium]|jgi:acetyl-CoA carboxylase carboxyl transferase subunit alpha|nr:acetyl-CoA carboxylase carboxyltransferase subunit alpha [Verrucomicrobiota bacterium]